MTLYLLEGPAGADKSRLSRDMRQAGEVSIISDVTPLWAALSGIEKDPATGKYPVRQADDPALNAARYLQVTAAAFALREGFNAVVTTSQRGQAAKWAEIATRHNSGFYVRTLDPGYETVRQRLSDPETGELSPECGQAISRWYGS